jgi:hypothetical protein
MREILRKAEDDRFRIFVRAVDCATLSHLRWLRERACTPDRKAPGAQEQSAGLQSSCSIVILPSATSTFTRRPITKPASCIQRPKRRKKGTSTPGLFVLKLPTVQRRGLWPDFDTGSCCSGFIDLPRAADDGRRAMTGGIRCVRSRCPAVHMRAGSARKRCRDPAQRSDDSRREQRR